MARIACILVPDFSIAAFIRANPELHDQPFALARADAPHAELTAVSARARSAGVQPAMTTAQARATLPSIAVLRESPVAERSATDALIDAAESFSPAVEAGAPGCAWLDLAGLARLFNHRGGAEHQAGSTADEDGAEAAMAGELARRARRVGLEASVGVASSKEVAHLAARCGGIRVIPAGREREFLNWLPLDLLGLGDGGGEELGLALARWGIRRLGELARLDSRAVGSRLGRRGVELVRIARGQSASKLTARRRAQRFAEEVELEYGIETLEPLNFVMRAMLDRLAARLKMRGFAAGDLWLSLKLADRRRDERRVAVAAATNEVRPLLGLIDLSLESSPPGAAVEAVEITAEPRLPHPAQADMFAPPCPAPDRLQTTVAKLAALNGPERVGSLAPDNSHRPEACRLRPFAPAAPTPSNGVRSAKSVTQLVIRAIRPAEEVEVLGSSAMPELVRGERICARVISAAGPWRRSGEWWRDGEGGGPFNRDYYELALADGAVYRLYCDLKSNRWFVDGIYD